MFAKNRDLILRTRDFAIAIVKLWQILPQRGDAMVLGKQLLRCATSVGANYRAASHAKSKADFWAKLKICEEEADECEYWLELLDVCSIIPSEQLSPLRAEAHEIACILSVSARKARETVTPHRIRSTAQHP